MNDADTEKGASPPEHAPLAAFQSALLDLLSRDLPPEQIMEMLKTDPAFEPYRAWIETFEPRMIETAALLVKKWSRREQPRELEGG